MGGITGLDSLISEMQEARFRLAAEAQQITEFKLQKRAMDLGAASEKRETWKEEEAELGREFNEEGVGIFKKKLYIPVSNESVEFYKNHYQVFIKYSQCENYH